jgi:phage gpG-like protein
VSYSESKKILNDLKKFEAEIPKVVSEMGSIGQNHFVKSFRDQGFTDNALTKWPSRKREDRGRGSRAILVKSGRLRRSIRRAPIGKYGVSLLSDVPYAKIHNDGLVGRAWGKHTFRMPKRQFMGSSRVMSQRIEKMIDRHVTRVFK